MTTLPFITSRKSKHSSKHTYTDANRHTCHPPTYARNTDKRLKIGHIGLTLNFLLMRGEIPLIPEAFLLKFCLTTCSKGGDEWLCPQRVKTIKKWCLEYTKRCNPPTKWTLAGCPALCKYGCPFILLSKMS